MFVFSLQLRRRDTREGLTSLAGVLLQHSHSFLHLGAKSSRVFEQMQQFRVIHFQKHASNLASKFRVSEVNLREETFTQHLLLLGLGGRDKGRGSQRFLTLLDERSLGDRLSLLRDGLLLLNRDVAGLLTELSVLTASLLVALLPSTANAVHGLRHHLLLLHGGAVLSASASHHLLLRHEAGTGTTDKWYTTRHLLHRGHVHDTGLLVHVGHLTLSSHGLHTLVVLQGELLLALFLALGKGDVEGLGAKKAAVHLSDSTSSLILRREADETKALGLATLVAHDLGAGDSAKSLESFAKLVIVNRVFQVLDVQVDTLVTGLELHSTLLVLTAEHGKTFSLLLGTTHIQRFSVKFLVVQLINSGLGTLGSFKSHKTEPTAGVGVGVNHNLARGDLAKGGEHLLEFLVVDVQRKVVDIDVGKLLLSTTVLFEALLAALEVTDVDGSLGFLVGFGFVITADVQQHAVHLVNGLVGSLGRVVVNESKATGVSFRVSDNLAGQNVAKGAEDIVQGLVVNALVQVFDEDVTDTRLAHGGIALGPHDAARTTLDGIVVQRVETALSVHGVVEVDVSVAQGATSDGITTDSDGGNGSNSVELLEQHGLSHLGSQVTNVQRGGDGLRGIGGSNLRRNSLGSLLSSLRLQLLLLLLLQVNLLSLLRGRGSGSGLLVFVDHD
eukprot:m.76961 g.76961  ORF g.76961 m.76961 type:complete len:670 (-) comp20641_c0_seq1:217-2226(-)